MKLTIDIDDNDYELLNKTGITIDLNTAFHGKEKDREMTFAIFNLIKALKNGTPVYEHEKLQGEWIPEESTFIDLNGIIETYTRFKCSICNQGQNFGEYPFCCWCGAKMEGIKS